MKLGLAASSLAEMHLCSRRKLSTCPAHLCSIFLEFQFKKHHLHLAHEGASWPPEVSKKSCNATRAPQSSRAEPNSAPRLGRRRVACEGKKRGSLCEHVIADVTKRKAQTARHIEHNLRELHILSHCCWEPRCQKRNPTQSAFATGHTVPDRRTFQCFERRAHKSAGLIGRCNRSARCWIFNGAVHLREQDYRCTSM